MYDLEPPLHLHRPRPPLISAPEQPGDVAGGGVLLVAKVLAALVDFVAGEVADHALDGVGRKLGASDKLLGAGDADLGAAAAELFSQRKAPGCVVGHDLWRDQARARRLAADFVERVVGDGHAAIPGWRDRIAGWGGDDEGGREVATGYGRLPPSS